MADIAINGSVPVPLWALVLIIILSFAIGYAQGEFVGRNRGRRG